MQSEIGLAAVTFRSSHFPAAVRGENLPAVRGENLPPLSFGAGNVQYRAFWPDDNSIHANRQERQQTPCLAPLPIFLILSVILLTSHSAFI